MIYVAYLLLSCHLTSLTVGQECAQVSVTSHLYAPLSVLYEGCNATTATTIVTKSRLDCARRCRAKSNCVAFSFDRTSKLCSTCNGDHVGDLQTLTSGQSNFYGLTENIKLPPFTSSNLNTTVDIPCGIAVGHMILLRGTYTSTVGFYLNVRVDPSNILLHFRVRLRDGTTDQYVLVSHKVKEVWATETELPFKVFPFTVAKLFVLNILAKERGFDVFINGDFVTNYTYVLPPSTVRSLNMLGTMLLQELSI